MVGASASWTSSDSSWVATLWGKNLSDELQISNRIVYLIRNFMLSSHTAAAHLRPHGDEELQVTPG